MEIYIKLSPKVDIISKKEILISDIAMIGGDHELTAQINQLKILTITKDSDENYLVTLLDIINLINTKYSQVVINNIGEDATVICYKKEEKKQNPILVFGKVLVVCLTLMCGGAVAIMTFQTDAAVADVFTDFYFLFLGDDSLKPYVIEIPYSIGISVGIITFYNHFSKLKITKDPSPIEVEIIKYNQDVTETIKEKLVKKEGQ